MIEGNQKLNSFRNTLHKIRITALSLQSQYKCFDLRTYIFRNPRVTNYKSIKVALMKRKRKTTFILIFY